MGWFTGAVSAVLFVASSAMFVYNVWRVATKRGEPLLYLAQMAFYAALMLVILANKPENFEGNAAFWTAFVLLLVSFGLTIAHKRRRSQARSIR